MVLPFIRKKSSKNDKKNIKRFALIPGSTIDNNLLNTLNIFNSENTELSSENILTNSISIPSASTDTPASFSPDLQLHLSSSPIFSIISEPSSPISSSILTSIQTPSTPISTSLSTPNQTPLSPKSERERANSESTSEFALSFSFSSSFNSLLNGVQSYVDQSTSFSNQAIELLKNFSMKHSIDFLIGPSREWSSDSTEVKMFRRNMEKHKRDETIEIEKFIKSNNPFHKNLPPQNTVPEWKLQNLKSDGFLCNIHLREYKMKKSSKILYTEIVDIFIESFVQKINDKHNLSLDTKNYVLRAQGSFYFLYGNLPFGHFSYIHKSIEKPFLDLYLVTIDSIIGSHEAKFYNYDYVYKNQNDIYTHSSLTIEQAKKDFILHHETNILDNLFHNERKYFSLWDLKIPFRVFVIGVDTIPITQTFSQLKLSVDDCALYVVIKLIHGGNSLSKKKFTRAIPYSNAPRFNQWIQFDDLEMCDLPRETKICFTLYCKLFNKTDPMLLTGNSNESSIGPKDYPVATISASVFDHEGKLKIGLFSPKMWLDEEGGALSSTAENVALDLSLPATTLSFKLQSFAYPVVFPTDKPSEYLKNKFQNFCFYQIEKYCILNAIEIKKLIDQLILKDPLYRLSKKEKWIIWNERNNLKFNPKALSKFLLSVPWHHPYAVYEAHTLLNEWAPIEPIDALELLDYNFGDSKVREFALSQLDLLDDEQLLNFLIQLVQILKFELGHDSSLARFLLQRSIRSPFYIGHYFFWHLVSEMHIPSIRERHGLLLEEFLRSCGEYHVKEFLKQKIILKDLHDIALKVKTTKKDKVLFLKEELKQVVPFWPNLFRLPLDPSMEASGINLDGCKVMDSKKLPLWISFKNSDPMGSSIQIIYKAGDDLRQDLLTLQVLRIMDSMWKKENLDLHINAYGCVCTDEMAGMIEVVLNSDTIASITSAGGGASAAFTKYPLERWLKKHNPTQEQYEKCVENFMFSCAGYCTATYILGIGDRHNDNIMLQKNGNLFHIDFGHFLGHYKSFAGIISRETSPFIFTKMYAHVLGKNSVMFNKFQDYGARAYNIIRSNGKVIITLFLLMLSTGIPELQSTKDIQWLCKCLHLEKTDEEGANHFKNCVKKALKNIRAQINDAAHIQIHNLNSNQK